MTPEDSLRYSRQITLPAVGLEGQEKLRRGSVVIVGAGGLGSPAALYLAAAGVGRLGIVDHDRVDLSNLHRQLLHGTSDVGRRKTESAGVRLGEANPGVRVEMHDTRISASNALEILRRYDVIVDGSDNFPTRYLINDAAVFLGKPNVYGSVYRFEGQASVFSVVGGPCYRCLYPQPPPPGAVPSCEEGGVMGVLPGIVGTIQATEALKLLLGKGDLLSGRVLLIDALSMRFHELRIGRDAKCVVCGNAPTVTELIDYEAFCGVGNGRKGGDMDDITPTELKARMDDGDAPRIIDVREPWEWELCRLDGAELLPMRRVPELVGRVDPHEEIVLYCRTGARSGRAMEFLRSSGLTRVRNLEGGIVRWARDVDPSMPVY